jgi:hypothetical protein
VRVNSTERQTIWMPRWSTERPLISTLRRDDLGDRPETEQLSAGVLGQITDGARVTARRFSRSPQMFDDGGPPASSGRVGAVTGEDRCLTRTGRTLLAPYLPPVEPGEGARGGAGRGCARVSR